MAQRCEHCRHWVDTVFKGQSASGWGVWYGVCQSDSENAPKGRDIDRHSLMIACPAFDPGTHQNSLNAVAERQNKEIA